jgi:hypothetical protein
MTLATAALAPAYNPGSWSTFFTLTGTAAATLTGLFFLAFSLRVGELQLSLVLRTRARYLLIWLIAIAISSGFVLMPGQSPAALAAEILVVSAGCAAYTAWSVLRTARRELPAFSFGVLLGIALEVAAAWSLIVWAGKDTRGQDIAPGLQRTPEQAQVGQLGAEQDGSRGAPGQLPDGR